MAFSLLGRLLDIEWLLARDEGRPRGDVAREDRELLAGRGALDPERALEVWLEGRRRERGGRTPGVRASETLSALHGVLLVLALAAGAGAAEALLGGASAAPTNVLHFLFATLVWPFALLLGSGLAFAVRGRLGRSVLLAELYLGALGLLGRLTRGREDWDVAAEWRKLRRSGRRYRDLEVAALVGAAQWYPLCFHLGAAARLLAGALFTDLSFAWSTTDDSLDAGTLGAVFEVLTAPWCAPLGAGCVDAELVAATRFSRFDAQFALPGGAARSGAWWGPLFGCLLVYGVLPRLGFWLGLRALVTRRSARLSERVVELRGRLRAGVGVVARRSSAEPDVAEPAPPSSGGARVAPAPRARCWVIRWRGALLDEAREAALCERWGLVPVRREAAGDSDFDRDRALLAAAADEPEAFLVIVEGWEAPDKATRRFVQDLRQSGAPERPVLIAVLSSDPDGPELAVWRDRLRLLEDPWVSVEAAAASSDRAEQEGVG